MSDPKEVRYLRLPGNGPPIPVLNDGYRFYLPDHESMIPNWPWASCMEYKHNSVDHVQALAEHFWNSLERSA